MVGQHPLTRSRLLTAVVALAVPLAAVTLLARQVAPAKTQTSPQEWAQTWDAERLPGPAAPLWTHADIERHVQRLSADTSGFYKVEPIGESIEGRRLYHVQVGTGPFPVLLWSQMHGDEPSATPALFDLLEWLRAHRAEPAASAILDRLTLHIVPMLNPDGAQRFERRNSQAIDINRDALRLQTPEGRALKALRDRVNARLGFNLHNQSWRTSVGRPPRPGTISLLSVAYDEARTENEGRKLTKRVCSVIRDSLEPFIPGQMGRYDDEFEVRAFGDNVTLWGTPVVLIETGPIAGPEPDLALTRLNFVAVMSALEAVATGRVHEADPARYEGLPMNESRLFHTLIVNATVAPNTGVEPFLADVAIGGNRVVRGTDAERRIQVVGVIEDVGDLRVHGALETIDATGKWVAPLPAAPVTVGQELVLPEIARRREGSMVRPGQPAALMLLAPVGEPSAARYRVERIVKFDDPRAGTGAHQ